MRKKYLEEYMYIVEKISSIKKFLVQILMKSYLTYVIASSIFFFFFHQIPSFLIIPGVYLLVDVTKKIVAGMFALALRNLLMYILSMNFN